MIPKPDNREQLLAETYHGDWPAGPAAAFPRTAARAARRHRTRRLALKASAITALVLAATVAITSKREPIHIARTVSTPAIAPAPAYEIISDIELLTLVHDRPLLLVQNDTATDGSRQIVTFDY